MDTTVASAAVSLPAQGSEPVEDRVAAVLEWVDQCAVPMTLVPNYRAMAEALGGAGLLVSEQRLPEPTRLTVNELRQIARPAPGQ
jgi:hypothetical protein